MSKHLRDETGVIRDGPSHTRVMVGRTFSSVEAKAATPWGQAGVIDELVLAQDADGKAFSSIVQLLEGNEGERFVRFAYSTDGVARRGPVTLRARDVEDLHRELAQHPALAEALGLPCARGGGGRRARAA